MKLATDILVGTHTSAAVEERADLCACARRDYRCIEYKLAAAHRLLCSHSLLGCQLFQARPARQ